MGAGFTRRFSADPGNDELTAIEGVVIIEREPPAALSGIGSGTVCCVGEFEDGDFAEPMEVASTADFLALFGSFGHTYAGVASTYPCAQKRAQDAALVPEYWNGNGFVALTRKAFRRLIVVRVDTSVGSVDLRRLACLKGAAGFTFDLEPAQNVIFKVDAVSVTATFTAVAATKQSLAGTYPSTFAGGEAMVIAVDGVEYTITFEAGDQSQANLISRVNTILGFTSWSDAGGGKTDFTGRKRGSDGSVQIVSLDALVATATGFSAGAAVIGTGNVKNIDAVGADEIHTIVAAAAVAAGTTAAVKQDEDQYLWLCNTKTPGTGALEITSATAVNLGWEAADAADADSGIEGTIPAGFRVKASGSTQMFVTTQSQAVTVSNGGPYRVKVRHASDLGTGTSEIAGAINTVPYEVPGGLGFWDVTNALPVTAALTESQIDAAYQAAIDATIDLSSVVRQTNIIVSARQSNAVRTALKVNANDASAQGCYGRMALFSAPLKLTRAAAKSTTVAPGVGAYRDRRCVYVFPGWSVQVPQIALPNSSSNGFTTTGIIDVHADTWLASVMSQLNPEENPGQETSFMGNVLGIEAGNSDVQGMGLSDYKAFRLSGICAPRMADGVAIFQSGVTSVNPTTQPNYRNIARQRMSDYITDTLATRSQSYVKKLSTFERRAALLGEYNGFLQDLKDGQRIDSFSIDGKSGNTPSALAQGIYRIIMKVKTFPSMDVIVIDSTVGESVQISAS